MATEARNVLIVEDDPTLSALVARILSGAGYRPVTIADHTLIDSAVARWDPRCVILDGEVRPSGESRTWDDAASIRRTHPGLPVVIFTGDGAALAEARAARSQRSVAAGFAGIVSKPFVVEELLATVKSAMARPAAATISVFPDIGRLAADWPEPDLFGTIVHELRGPLTAIRAHVQIARRRMGQDPARERASLDSAITQVDRMSALIGDLLDQARLASNGLSLEVILFDLVGAVADSVAAHDYEQVHRIAFERPPGAIHVQGDPGRITQIIDNLLSNALKYSAADAPVALTLTLNGDEVDLRVTDNGLGVPADEQDMLFTPFYRTSVTRNVRGTGLGLHISRRLAERHGGRLCLESTNSAGSTFVLTLPVPSRELTQS
jgi:signal transduction histidine kinase